MKLRTPLSARLPRRRTRRLGAVAALALAAIGGPAGAQSPASAPAADTLPLSIEEAVRRAASQSEEVLLAQRQVDLAAAQVTVARSQALPQVNGRVNYTRTFRSPFQGGGISIPDSMQFSPDSTLSLAERVSYIERNAALAGLGGIGGLFGNLPFGQANAYTAAVSGSQLVYSGGRVGAALDIADDYREIARLGLVEETADVELQVRTAYYRAAFADELVTISRAAVEQAEAFLADQRLRFETGTISELDLLRAEVSAENLRPSLVEAENAADLARRELRRLVNLPESQPVVLTTALAAPAPATAADTLPSDALRLAQRAAVAAAGRQVEIGENQVRIARGSYLPNVALSVNYGGQLFPTSAFGLGSADWRPDFTAGLEVSVPIFNGFRRRGEVQEAQVNLDRTRLQLAQLEESVELQYRQAVAERTRARATIGARTRTVEQAQRVHDLTVLRYEQGLATQLEVSDARLALLQARTNVAQALADFYTADASVTRALAGTTEGTR